MTEKRGHNTAIKVSRTRHIVDECEAPESQGCTSPACFARLCDVLFDIMRTRSTCGKVTLFASYLKSLKNDDDVFLAVQFTAEGAFSTISGRRAKIGHRTIALTASNFCGVDYEKVFKPCKTATGNASETIEKLMLNLPEAARKRSPTWMTLITVSNEFEKIEAANGRIEKQLLLSKIWERMTAREIRFMIHILSQSSIQIGFELQSILMAIADAYDSDPLVVQRVHMLTGSIGEAAILARQNKLESASFQMFQPVAFMLAAPLEKRALTNPHMYVAEDRLDGLRTQVHLGPDKVQLFSRDLKNVTATFPDVAARFIESLRRVNNDAYLVENKQTNKKISVAIGPIENLWSHTQEVVLDGVICALTDGRIQPFQKLQKRMGVKNPPKKLLEELPVIFIAYDLLFLNGDPILDQPVLQRRLRLDEFCQLTGTPCIKQYRIEKNEDIHRLFQQALKNGNEGLILKHRNSVYEYGQRNKSWLKVKQSGETMYTVIMYAHEGGVRRGGFCSDFTLGIRVDDDNRYKESFIPIGKASIGCNNKGFKKLNERIRELAVERFGRTISLKPGIVAEVEFDSIQINRRTKAGYTLQLPRFKAICWDLSSSDTDSLLDVEKYFKEKSSRKHRALLTDFIANLS